MAVLLNRSICDNDFECFGIEVCPTGALFWNSDENQIGLDNNLCISCKECVSACPIGAFVVADNEYDYNNYLSNFNSNTEPATGLFVERYGAAPIDEESVIDEKTLVTKLQEMGNSTVLVEKFKEESIQCLLLSIPVEQLTKKTGAKFIKCYVEADKNGIYPQLLVFKNMVLIGTIEGYFDNNDADILIEKLRQLLTDEKN